MNTDNYTLYCFLFFYTVEVRRKIHHLLSLAGLREDEVTLYLNLLALKRASMTDLIAASSLNIMTAYRTMKRLQERGLVQAFSINQKQSVYAPLTLKALIRKLDTEQRTLRKVQLALQDLDPLLPYVDLHAEATDGGSQEPVELKEGLDAFREEYLKLPDFCDSEYLHVGSMQNYWDIAGMGDESPEEMSFRAKRYRRGVFARVINTDSPAMREVAKRDSKEMRTLRIVDDIPIRKDYVGFARDYIAHFVCNKESPRVILVRHPELLALYRNQFKAMWERGRG